MHGHHLICLAVAALLCVAVSAHAPHPMSYVLVDNVVDVSGSEPGGSVTVSSPWNATNQTAWVSVSWSMEGPLCRDAWLGVYSPAGANLTAVAPIKFKWVYETEGHLAFRLINTHHNYDFALFCNGLKYPSAVARSEPVSFAEPNMPMSVHIAQGETPDTMFATWTSLSSAGSPRVRYWATAAGPASAVEAAANSTTYGREDMCAAPATTHGFREPGSINTAAMTGLVPGRAYSYQVGSDASSTSKIGAFASGSAATTTTSSGGSWSSIIQFTAAPAPSAAHETRMVVYGDLGTLPDDDSWVGGEVGEPGSRNTTRSVAAMIDAGLVDHVMHIGDVSYARGYAASWTEAGLQFEPVASRVPYHVVVGNHELDQLGHFGSQYRTNDSGGECGVPCYKHYPKPAGQWYAYTRGCVRVVAMNTEVPYTPGSPQNKWIESELAAVDRSVTPWVIVVGHRPMYIDSSFVTPPDGDKFVAGRLRDALEDYLIKYGVDLAMWGHFHAYQRTCPIKHGVCSKGGPVHTVVGNAGYHLAKPSDYPPTPAPFMDVINGTAYGYGYIQANATHLHFQARQSTVELDDSLIDEFYLTNQQ